MDYSNVTFIGDESIVERVKEGLSGLELTLRPDNISLAGIVSENGVVIYPALPNQKIEGMSSCVRNKYDLSGVETRIPLTVDGHGYELIILWKNILDFYMDFIRRRPGCRFIRAF